LESACRIPVCQVEYACTVVHDTAREMILVSASAASFLSVCVYGYKQTVSQ
jgi:hypothetical protein